MTKRTIWAVVAVFIAWSILDFILHGLLLRSTYEATANLWRPMDQMNTPLMYFLTLVFAVCFVLIYGLLVGQKSLASGIRFEALLGLAHRHLNGVRLLQLYAHSPDARMELVSWKLDRGNYCGSHCRRDHDVLRPARRKAQQVIVCQALMRLRND